MVVSSYLKGKWTALHEGRNIPERDLRKTYEALIEYYQEDHRMYHSLSHLEAMFRMVDGNRDLVKDMRAMEYAIWFHDAIYNPRSSENEIRSAAFAEVTFFKWEFPIEFIYKVTQMIISTAKHQPLIKDTDCLLFLDIDLSILGSDSATYQAYTHAIRTEYNIYPDFLYNRGRKQILQGFLERSRIYFTDLFYNLYEASARQNLELEVSKL